jgi:phytoene desaturase
LINGLAGLIDGLGGSIRYDTTVSRIQVKDGRATGVVLEGGEELAADIVVSNADSAWTYKHLLADHKRRRWSDRKLDSRSYSMGLFVWYFGTKRKFEDVEHHTMVLGPRYEELLTDIFARHILADDCSLYLHRPTATDPDLAPEGCDSFYVLSPVPNLRSGTDWAAEGERYRKLIEKRLEDTVMPGLSEALVTSEIMTPQDFRDRLLSEQGAAFSLEPTLFQSAWFRPHNLSEEVENLFLVGAGSHPGAGMPGVLSSARVIDKLVPDADSLTTVGRTSGDA